MENDGKIITAKYVHPNYEIRKVVYVAHESVDEISDAVVKKINELMTAEKKGKWINHRNDEGHNIADCDQCGEAMQWFDDDIKPNYCPNCGARMEE